MAVDLTILLVAAASIGLFHTLFGPDHYLPFVVMARARRWSMAKTTWITVLCGVGHILGSVALGLVGIALGTAVKRLEAVESFRGNLAAWGLIAFGLVYFVWGLRRAFRRTPHAHHHAHGAGESHVHTHTHTAEHVHVHADAKANTTSLTPWVLFTIFAFGPCEPLIPILMYPAAKSSILGVALVAGVFAVVTVLTMTTIVLVSSFGISFGRLGRFERYSHALAGAAICLSGLAVQFLGL